MDFADAIREIANSVPGKDFADSVCEIGQHS